MATADRALTDGEIRRVTGISAGALAQPRLLLIDLGLGRLDLAAPQRAALLDWIFDRAPVDADRGADSTSRVTRCSRACDRRHALYNALPARVIGAIEQAAANRGVIGSVECRRLRRLRALVLGSFAAVFGCTAHERSADQPTSVNGGSSCWKARSA